MRLESYQGSNRCERLRIHRVPCHATRRGQFGKNVWEDPHFSQKPETFRCLGERQKANKLSPDALGCRSSDAWRIRDDSRACTVGDGQTELR